MTLYKSVLLIALVSLVPLRAGDIAEVCSPIKEPSNCEAPYTYYCLVQKSVDRRSYIVEGCFLPVNCPPGRYLSVSNASRPDSLNCLSCPNNTESKTANQSYCETSSRICPEGYQTTNKVHENIVGVNHCVPIPNDKELEEGKRSITVTIIALGCFLGFFLLAIVMWRCMRREECYVDKVHIIKRNRIACAAWCRRSCNCCNCYSTKEIYAVEGDRDIQAKATGLEMETRKTVHISTSRHSQGNINPACSFANK